MSKVVVVTGAAQGLGQAIAERFLASGDKVVFADINIDLAQQVCKSHDASGENTLSLYLDVLDKNSFINALAATIEKFGRCDVLINNAAITPTTAAMDVTSDEFDMVLATNLRGALFGCQVFGAYFADKGMASAPNVTAGRIINMASLAGQMGGTASGVHYASSKAGIITLTKVFARELAANAVTVNAVAPGPVDVPSIREKVPAEKLDAIIKNMVPVQQMSAATFIADMVVMLAADNAGCTTGACWDSNGGIFMR